MTKQSYVQGDFKWGYRFRSCIEKQARCEDDYLLDKSRGFERDLNASSHMEEFVIDLNKYDELVKIEGYPDNSKKQEDLKIK